MSSAHIHDTEQLIYQSKFTRGHHMRCVPPPFILFFLPSPFLVLSFLQINHLPSIFICNFDLAFLNLDPTYEKKCSICLIYLNMIISSSSAFLYGHHFLTLFPLNTFPYLAITIFPEQLIFMSLSSLKKSSVRAQLTYTRSPC